MNVNEREKALIKVVDEYRETECQRLLRKAKREAAILTGRMYKKNRRLLHDRVVAERKRAEVRIRAARAKFETIQRRHLQKASLAILEAGWYRLEPRLQSRWQDAASRKQWVDAVLQNGLKKLPRQSWIIRHPVDWEKQEQEAVVARLVEQLEVPPVLEPDKNIRAGLTIESAGTRLDSTPDGLLKDRNAIEARLLAALDMEQSQ